MMGFFFSRYAMLVAPVNYMLCSVNIALFSSSAWHLGRKINADYIEDKTVEVEVVVEMILRKYYRRENLRRVRCVVLQLVPATLPRRLSRRFCGRVCVFCSCNEFIET